MLQVLCFVLTTVLLTASHGEAVKCYHCYQKINATSTLATCPFGENCGEKFIPCDKDKANWNTWNCPSYWPVCVVVFGKVRDHYEISRSCAEKNFCSKYVPPVGVKVETCRECNTTLCNDAVEEVPDFPVDPSTPLFVFNVNINLRLLKTYRGDDDDDL